MIFDENKSNYTPKIWAYALSLYFHQRVIESFTKNHFEKAIEVEKAWDKIWRNLPYVHIELTDTQIQKQLEFMGYVKEEDFKFHDLYAYVSSNRKINGSFYILNKRFVDNINSIDMRQSYQYIYNTWDDYTLEGYTKILTHGTRP